MDVERGAICRARALGLSRLVLVTQVDGEWAQVSLLTNELELAGDQDVLLERGASGLPCSLLASLDLQGPCWLRDLEPLARVDPTLLEQAASGLPIRSRQDGRWQWKLRELAVLQRIGGDCLRQLLD